MRGLAAAVFTLVLLVGAGSGGASGLRDFGDSWLISAADARELLLDNPLEAGSRGNFWAMAGQGRLFEMKELEQRFLGAGGRFFLMGMPLKLGGQWERTGADLFVEHRLGWWILLGQQPAWGFSGNWTRKTLGYEHEIPHLEGNLLWRLPFAWEGGHGNIQWQWPIGTTNTDQRYTPRRNVLKATIVLSDLAFALVVDRFGHGIPSPGLQFLWSMGGQMGVECRVDPSTGSLGPGLAVVRGCLLLRTSHVVHPRLGITHRLLLVIGKPQSSRP